MQTIILNFIKVTEDSPKGFYCRHIKKQDFFRKGLIFYQTRKLWTELKLKVIADEKMNVPQLVISVLIGQRTLWEKAKMLEFSFFFFLNQNKSVTCTALANL